jgi:hypothetical protein
MLAKRPPRLSERLPSEARLVVRTAIRGEHGLKKRNLAFPDWSHILKGTFTFQVGDVTFTLSPQATFAMTYSATLLRLVVSALTPCCSES